MRNHKITFVAILTILAVFLAGCNTVEGAGDDIKSVGTGISDAAESVSDGK